MRAGLNHLALVVDDRAALDRIRDDAWAHAGGPDHVALFIENDEGFEIELVAEPDRF